MKEKIYSCYSYNWSKNIDVDIIYSIDTYNENILSFVNNKTIDGELAVGFKTAITKAFNDYAKDKVY